MPTPNNPATTTGAANEVQNPKIFAEITERQEMPQNEVKFPGFGKKVRFEIEKVGCIARCRFVVLLKFKTSAAGTGTLLPGWPFKLISSIALQTNGVTGILSARGVTYEARKARIFRNPAHKAQEYPAVGNLEKSKSYSIRYVVEVPITHDMLSLLGILLAQNEQTQLSLVVEFSSEAELVTYTESGKLETVEGAIEWKTTTFSIGETVIEGKNVVVLPDLSAYHGLIDEKVPVISHEVKSPLIRTAGQLLCYTVTVMNGEATNINPASFTQFIQEYGGNKKPLVWQPPIELLAENEDDYNGPLEPGGMNFLAIDNEKDNPTRDLWIPEALVELRSSTTISAAVNLETTAYEIYSQETLYPTSAS